MNPCPACPFKGCPGCEWQGGTPCRGVSEVGAELERREQGCNPNSRLTPPTLAKEGLR